MHILALLLSMAWPAAAAYVPGQVLGHMQAVQSGDTVAAPDTSAHFFATYGTIPAGLLLPSGSVRHEAKLEASGSGSALPGGGTLTFSISMGSTVIFTAPAIDVDNSSWYLTFKIRGTSSTAIAVDGRLGSGPGSGSYTRSAGVPSSGDSGAHTGVTLSAAQNVKVCVTFTAAGGGNTVTMSDYVLTYVY